MKNGELHFPSHAARIQLGIWDASTPFGTAAWAKGPIDWEKAPEKIIAVVRDVKVECPENYQLLLFAVSFQAQITSNTKLARLHYYDPDITVSNTMSNIIPVWTFGTLYV